MYFLSLTRMRWPCTLGPIHDRDGTLTTPGLDKKEECHGKGKSHRDGAGAGRVIEPRRRRSGGGDLRSPKGSYTERRGGPDCQLWHFQDSRETGADRAASPNGASFYHYAPQSGGLQGESSATGLGECWGRSIGGC